MSYFKVLPTDRKYLDLSDRQKLLLFEMFCEFPSPEELKFMMDKIGYVEKQKISDDEKTKLQGMQKALGLDDDAFQTYIGRINADIEAQTIEEVKDIPFPKLFFPEAE